MNETLFSKLKTLNININTTSEIAINSWFDYEDSENAAFLKWFSQNVNRNNCLEHHEKEEYETLVHKDLILTGDKYTEACNNLIEIYPGILDFDRNIQETCLMEREFSMLQVYEEDLQKQITAEKNISKKLSRQKSALVDEITLANVEMQNNFEKCAESSKNYENLYEDLSGKVEKCSQNLTKMSNNSNALYLMNTSDRSSYHKDIEEYLSVMIKDDYFAISNLSSTIIYNDESGVFNSIVANGNNEEIVTIEKRLLESIEERYFSEMKKVQAEAVLKFYNDLNFMETASLKFNDRCPFKTEESILSRKLVCERSIIALKNIFQKIVDIYISKPKLNKIKRSIDETRNYFDIISSADSTSNNIVIYTNLLYQLFQLEHKDIDSYNSFFADVFDFINDDLNSWKIRTEYITEITQQYDNYALKSLGEKSKIVQIITNLLSVERIQHITVDCFTNIVINFNRKVNSIEEQIFTYNITNHRDSTDLLEKHIYSLKQYLKSESSNELLIYPAQHYNVISELNENMKKFNENLKNFVDQHSNAKQILKEDKWLKIRRQLWMYFLHNPKKVLYYIDEIEKEVKKRRNEQFQKVTGNILNL